MKVKTNSPALRSVHFVFNRTSEPHNNYMFTIKPDEEGRQQFVAEYPRALGGINAYNGEAPDRMMEKIAEMARATGAADPAERQRYHVDEERNDRVMLVHCLKWADGTETGPGEAKGLMLAYLREVAEQCGAGDCPLARERHEAEKTALKERLFPGKYSAHLYEKIITESPMCEKNVANPPSLVGVSLRYSFSDKYANYAFSIETQKNGEVDFDASCFCGERYVSFLGARVSGAALTEIAEIARHGGELGGVSRSPAVVRNYPPGARVSEPMREVWVYGLLWAGGVETGVGDAKTRIVQYLCALAEKCANES